jgi:uncharacterized protein (TIGR03067 family)
MIRGMLLLLSVQAFGFPPVREGPKDTPQSLTGKWLVTKWTMDGVEQPPEACKQKAFVFNEKKLTYIFIFDGTESGVEYELATDPNARPSQFDAKFNAKTLSGIFRVDHNTADICWSEFGAARPTQFVSREKNTTYFQLQRVK